MVTVMPHWFLDPAVALSASQVALTILTSTIAMVLLRHLQLQRPWWQTILLNKPQLLTYPIMVVLWTKTVYQFWKVLVVMKTINLVHTLSSGVFCLCMCTNKWGFLCSFVFKHSLCQVILKYDVTGILQIPPFWYAQMI